MQEWKSLEIIYGYTKILSPPKPSLGKSTKKVFFNDYAKNRAILMRFKPPKNFAMTSDP